MGSAPADPGRGGGLGIRDIDGPRDVRLRLIERDIQLAALETPLHVSVAVSRASLEAELVHFTRLVTLSLVVLGLLVFATLALQVHWGLAPLRRMQADLRRVENGEVERLDTRLPSELSRLAVAMNGILARDRRLMEHARHAAGNLAHALKTPVSVLSTLAEGVEEPRRYRLRNELGCIDAVVHHHLTRPPAMPAWRRASGSSKRWPPSSRDSGGSARGARLDEQRSGSGLGLAIVSGLVVLYGGRLELERSVLGGLAVRVWLPARPLQGGA